MAVSVNRVYQTVLTLLNKEQRGYLPPQDFNLLAAQSQIEIFENYFYELGKASATYGEMTEDYASIADHVFEKLIDFELSASITPTSGVFPLPADLYRLQTIVSNNIEVMMKRHRDVGYMLRSPLTEPNAAWPNYTRVGNTITLYPNTISDILVHYIRELATTPTWVGTVVMGQVVPAPTSVDFEIHSSEEPELVAKILAYAGLHVKAQDVQEFAISKDSQITQSET